MENILTFIFSNTIIAFIILISVIIFFHEFGHFIAGKLFGIQVEEFSIGFGPQAISFKKGPTVYRINWLPLGGYVRFYGSDIEENIPIQNHSKSFLHAKLYQRACVTFAGPFANFVLSFFVMLILVLHGLPAQPTNISVMSNSVAMAAGLQTGDKILSINHQKVESWNELSKIISDSSNKNLNLEIERNHQIIFLNIKPHDVLSETIYGSRENSGKIGVSPIFSISSIQPNRGDFFDQIGLKSQDLIISVQDIKIKYLFEFYNEIYKVTNCNSDFCIAQKISNSKLMPNFNIEFIRNDKVNNIKVNFSDKIWHAWALKVKNNKFYNSNWSQSQLLSDLKIKQFILLKNTNQEKSLNAWKKCGLEPGMIITDLGDNQKLNNVIQVYSYFESFKFYSKNATQIKNPIISITAQNKNGLSQNFSCTIPLIEKGDHLNRSYFGLEFPFEFMTSPEPLPAMTIHSQNFLDAIQKSFHYLWNQMTMIYKGLKMLFSGNIPLSNLGGPIAVASLAGDAAKAGLMTFLLTMSLISVNIGMVNLLPLPALDGGYLLLYFVEAFYGKPLPKSVQIGVQRIGIFLLLGLFILVFYNDILRLFHL